jgi:hypothetical protein
MPVRAVGGSLQLSGRNIGLVIQETTRATSLAAAATESVELTPPTGTIGLFLWFGFEVAVVPGATSGDHKIEVYQDQYTTKRILFGITSAFGAAIRVDAGKPVTGSVNTSLHALSDFLRLSHKLPFTSDYPIGLRYTNNTDAAQTGTRTYLAAYMTEGVTS